MKKTTVKLKFQRISARKIRPVLALIRGKGAADALAELTQMPWRSAKKLLLLLRSALAAAKEKDLKEDDLYIAEIRCDEGPRLRRRRFISRARTAPYMHRTSHITLTLAEKPKSVNK